MSWKNSMLLFLHFPALLIGCDLKLDVRGELSTGVDVHVGMNICSPDENSRKVKVTWEALEEEKRIPRAQLQRLLSSVSLGQSEIKQVTAERNGENGEKAACYHKMSVRIERDGMVQTFEACERTTAHLLARKFYDVVLAAHFFK